MMVVNKYKNPPLTEAIFEIYFETENWTPASPGLFYNKVSKNYPIIAQAQNGIGFILGATGVHVETGANQLTQYKSNDGTDIIQLSSGLLTVNKLPRYNGWGSYRNSIVDAVENLKSVVKLKKTIRLGLKTLNKIDIKSHSFEQYKKYYTILPSMPESLNYDWTTIQLNLEVPQNSGEDILAIQIATILKEPAFQAPTLLQLYVTRIKNADSVGYEEWINEAHIRLNDLFEKSLTPSCKSEF